jgi:hypothetical protein
MHALPPPRAPSIAKADGFTRCAHAAGKKRLFTWILFWATCIACLYLPTLTTGFDFIDDGNLVYPSEPMSPVARLQLLWDKIAANFEHLGPFRPVLWLHWETAAELLQGQPVYWRAARLLWTALAAAAFLRLLRELGIRPGAAIFTTALALWNPFRSEIWTSLTLAEGVAMPYAIAALVCAVRGARSSRPWRWDLAGALAVLFALGCKNTFAALVPGQIVLRLLGGGLSFREAIRRHSRKAVVLTLPLLMPIIHFVVFKLTWHSGQYTTSATWAQASAMLRALAGAESLDFLGLGLALALVAVWIATRTRTRRPVAGTTPSVPALAMDRSMLRATLLAGAALLIGGYVLYLPIGGVAGRYSMPAVWGIDLAIAVLLTNLSVVPRVWRRAAYAALACGLAVVMVQNLGKQRKFAARSKLLWSALECVEQQAPVGACLGWLEDPRWGADEGIHLYWHLCNRGRRDIELAFLDGEGRQQFHEGVPPPRSQPFLLLSGTQGQPPEGPWHQVRSFTSAFWGKQRHYDCYLWERSIGVASSRSIKPL